MVTVTVVGTNSVAARIEREAFLEGVRRFVGEFGFSTAQVFTVRDGADGRCCPGKVRKAIENRALLQSGELYYPPIVMLLDAIRGVLRSPLILACVVLGR